MQLRAWLVLLFAATSAAAQIRPIFDPDDFVDPRERRGSLLISRLVIGATRDSIDDYRPLHQDARVFHLANAFYWSNFQVDWKHSEVRGEHGNDVEVCPCQPPVYFPPISPLPERMDALQFAWYRSTAGPPASPRVMLRYRVTISQSEVRTRATYLDTGHFAGELHGHDRSIGIDADTYVHIGEHEFFGTLLVAHSRRTGTVKDESRNEATYVSRFPGWRFRKVFVRATVAVGGVSGGHTQAINIVNPALEAFVHDWSTKANVRLIWSPIALRGGRQGWSTQHQVALTVDRALFVKLFRVSP